VLQSHYTLTSFYRHLLQSVPSACAATAVFCKALGVSGCARQLSSVKKHPWFEDHQWLERKKQRKDKSDMEKAALRNRPVNLQKEKRSIVLSSMLRNALQEVFISGCVGRCLQSVQISKVRMDINLTKVQVSWMTTGSPELDSEIDAALLSNASEIRLLELAKLKDRFETVEESEARLKELYKPSVDERKLSPVKRQKTCAPKPSESDNAENFNSKNLTVYGLDREALVRKVANEQQMKPRCLRF
uniref:AGC-kinase C-terminal domain-containing protein n=1 Tax=Macrostomum lignano TaxID=282301 RepID=A0A1I8GXT0_9PLAT